jgi:hypothetical protein
MAVVLVARADPAAHAGPTNTGARSVAKNFCTVANAAASGMSMRRSVLLIGFCAAAALLLWAQRDRPGDHPAYEVRALMPPRNRTGAI